MILRYFGSSLLIHPDHEMWVFRKVLGNSTYLLNYKRKEIFSKLNHFKLYLLETCTTYHVHF